jgi:hypothetical protein
MQARTALRRGTPLLKYCRNAKPHVAHFQLTVDETKLEWVAKSAKTKHVPIGLVTEVLHGRQSDLFKKATSKHPPELCLSVIYYESESDKKKTSGVRSLDLVCADASQARMWVYGLRAVRERLASARSSPAAADSLATAMAVGKAAGKFMRKLSAGARAGSSLSRLDDYDDSGGGAGPLREPGDLLLWGRVPSVMTLDHNPSGGGSGGGSPGPATTTGRGTGTGTNASTTGVSAATSGVSAAASGGVSAGGGSFSAGVSAAGGGGGGVSASALASLNALLAPERRWAEWLTPTTVPGTEGLDVVSVSVGSRHAAAVVRGQGVYTWGDGGGGRLGSGTTLSRAKPAKLFALGGGGGGGGKGEGGDPGLERRLLPGSKVGADDVQLCCGASYTVALTTADDDADSRGGSAGGVDDEGGASGSGGRCFVWGDGGGGSPGLLGRGGGGNSGHGGVDAVVWMPLRIGGALTHRRVSQISCGSYHAVGGLHTSNSADP